MNVTYPPSTELNGEGRVLLEQATKQLEGAPGQSKYRVTAIWERVENGSKRPLYRLKLQDSTGEVSADFTTDQLRDPVYMHVRLYFLWGDHLKIRSDEIHRSVIELAAQISAAVEDE